MAPEWSRLSSCSGSGAAGRKVGPHRMRRQGKKLVLVLLLLFAFGPFGRTPAWGQQAVETGPGKPEQAVERVIVQLAAPPVLAYRLATVSGQAGRGSGVPGAREAQSLLAYGQRLEEEQQQVVARLREKGLLVESTWHYTQLFNGFVALVPAARIKELVAVPGVRALFPDQRVHATLADSVPLIGAPAVWAMTDPSGRAVRGQGVRVAIIDTGVDYTHPDLGGCFGPACKVIGGYDFVNKDLDPRDDNGHGTHVAGIIAASGTVTGVAPEASLYALKVLDSQGSGWTSDIIAALQWAVDPDGDPATDDGAQVVNLSLGGPGGPDDAVSQAVDAAVDAGVVVAVAAGNTGDQGFFTIGSPGTARKAITVGASAKNDTLASFSSNGPVSQGWLLKPDLLAPGVSIQSTIPGVSYAHYSGTSMATPHIAGGAALLRQLHPDWSPLHVKAVLMNTALDLGLNVLSQGTGRVQLAAAASPWAVADPGSLSLGLDVLAEATWTGTARFTLTNSGGNAALYSLSVGSGLPAGVNGTLSAGSLTLAPGASAPVTLTVEVDNGVLTPPGSPTFTVAGKVLVQLEGNTLPVPFGFGVQQGADAYEPDDGYSQARPIVPDSTPQTHNFHVAWDEDWVSFTATQGTTYVVETGNLGPDCDTVLRLIAGDGTTELAYDDDSGVGVASLITWTAPADGTYFVRAHQFNGSVFGDNTYFDLWINTVQIHADGYEPDNAYDRATSMPADGMHQTHNFHTAGDEDWVSFTAAAGSRYTIETGNLGLSCDTILQLYDTDGTTELVYDDDGSDEPLASRITWTAPASGVYFARVHDFSPSGYGDSTGYDLWLTVCSLPEDLNGSGVVDLADLQAITNRWDETSATPGWDPRFDLDGNQKVDMIDVMGVAKAWGRSCP